jgi:CDP-diacylglycerol pyrophosphatase
MPGSVSRLFFMCMLCTSILSAHALQAATGNELNEALQGCEDQYKKEGNYGDCSLMNYQAGYVILKTRTASDNQFLLLPMDNVTGIEDEGVLSRPYTHPVSNLFYSAWQSRGFVFDQLKQRGKKLAEKDIALTINPVNSRTQNHLHIHISCLAAKTQQSLSDLDIEKLGWGWESRPLKNKNDRDILYDIRKLSATAFLNENIFDLVHERYRSNMKYAEVTVVPARTRSDEFLLLVNPGSVSSPATAEELQDHSCTVAKLAH